MYKQICEEKKKSSAYKDTGRYLRINVRIYHFDLGVLMELL